MYKRFFDADMRWRRLPSRGPRRERHSPELPCEIEENLQIVTHETGFSAPKMRSACDIQKTSLFFTHETGKSMGDRKRVFSYIAWICVIYAPYKSRCVDWINTGI